MPDKFSMLLSFLTFVQKKNKTSNILQETLYWPEYRHCLLKTFSPILFTEIDKS